MYRGSTNGSFSWRRTHSLGESALKGHLERAQQKITSLEGYIKERERLLQQSGTSMRSKGSTSHRQSRPSDIPHIRRRVGLTHDATMVLHSMGASFSHHDNEIDNMGNLDAPLGEFICLKLVRVLESPMPFLLRRLIGRVYHIGPRGALIGTSPHCSIVLPVEADVLKEHCRISWMEMGMIIEEEEGGAKRNDQKPLNEHGQFVLEKLTFGEGLMYILDHNTSVDAVDDDATPTNTTPPTRIVTMADIESATGFPLYMTHGVRFVTGKLVWEVSALPKEVELKAKLFHLAERRELEEMQEMISRIESSHCQLDEPIPTFSITGEGGSTPLFPTCPITPPSSTTPTLSPLNSYDVDTEYKSPSYHGDNLISLSASPKSAPDLRAESINVPTLQFKERPSLLLHVAISNNDINMVKYLLDKEANVNKASGDPKYTAVHLAALKNNAEIMALLLKYGGDVEMRNIDHLQPLALTTSYDVRKLILNSILLCAAADDGDISEVTRLLTTTPISPNVKGLRRKAAIHLAAAKGHVDVVQLLIVNGADVNIKGGTRSRTALHYASQRGHKNVVKLLLDVGANEFVRDINGYTPLNICQGDVCNILNKQPMTLCIAVQSGSAEAVRSILDKELDRGGAIDIINHRNDQGHAPLHLACIMGSFDMVQLLVSYGAMVNIHGGSDSWTPLFYAAMAGHCHIAEFLISVGADPEEVDTNGDNICKRVEKEVEDGEEKLARLKQRDRSESIMEMDMIKQISVNMMRMESCPSGSVESEVERLTLKLHKMKEIMDLLTSPAEKLLAAMQSDNITEFTALLEMGVVSPNISFSRHIPIPILVRVCEDGMYGYVKALLDNGAKIDVQGPADHIPLLVAASNDHTQIVKLLVERGANINIQSSDTLSTALHEAASMNNIDTIRYLLSAGADATIASSTSELPFDCTTDPTIRQLLASGNNRLLISATINDTTTLQRLINDDGLQVDTEFYHNGHTPLHEACLNGRCEAVQLLLDLGADVNKRGGVYQNTPLHIASAHDHDGVVKILLQHGAKLDIKDSEGKVPFEVASTNTIRKLLVEARKPHLQPHPPPERSSDQGKLCIICMENAINSIVLPCGHQVYCVDCVTKISICALDREQIREIIPVYH